MSTNPAMTHIVPSRPPGRRPSGARRATHRPVDLTAPRPRPHRPPGHHPRGRRDRPPGHNPRAAVTAPLPHGSVAIVPGVAGRIEWVHEAARFAELGEEWERVAALNGSPFADHAWFQAWWEAFGTGQLAVCVLWEDGQLRAALPLSEARGRLTGLANFHTPAFAIPAHDAQALDRVVEEALRRSHGELALHAVVASDPLREALVQAAASQGQLLLVEQIHR